MVYFEVKMKFLIVYGTTEGQTRKIAYYMAKVLQNSGHNVLVAEAIEEPPSPIEFDAVLIGASIHIGAYQSAVTHYIKNYLNILNSTPGAFFSVCLAIASDIEDEHQEVARITKTYLDKVGWRPNSVIQIAGALKYTQYNFFKRLLMKMIAKKEGRTTDTAQDYEYTDWEAVKTFVLEFEKEVSNA